MLDPFGARVLRSAKRVATQGLSFMLPQRCAMCASPTDLCGTLCGQCFAAIPRWASPLCVRCLVNEREPVGCSHHVGWVAHVPWVYEERSGAMIHAIKFGGRRRLARALASELRRVVPLQPRLDTIVTVPLHRLRARQRGYNQVVPLAEGLADGLGVPHIEGVLQRVRHTEAQTHLRGHDRRRNLEGAFRVTRPTWLAGRRVLVLDDVITTGATLAAAMQAVRDAGGRPTGAALAWAQ